MPAFAGMTRPRIRMHLGRVLEMAESSNDRFAYERKIVERFGGQQELELVMPTPPAALPPAAEVASGAEAKPMTTRKIIFGVLGAVPLCLLAWAVAHHLHVKSVFARIVNGTSRADIIASLGEPWWVGVCGNWGGRPPDGCVQEIGYTSALGLFTDLWVVSFDANDKAVRKYRYRSP